MTRRWALGVNSVFPDAKSRNSASSTFEEVEAAVFIPAGTFISLLQPSWLHTDLSTRGDSCVELALSGLLSLSWSFFDSLVKPPSQGERLILDPFSSLMVIPP